MVVPPPAGAGSAASSAAFAASSSSSAGSFRGVVVGTMAPAPPTEPPAKTSAGQSMNGASAVFSPSPLTSARPRRERAVAVEVDRPRLDRPRDARAVRAAPDA